VVGELLKQRFLKLVGATTDVIIGGGCAKSQSPHFERWAASLDSAVKM